MKKECVWFFLYKTYRSFLLKSIGRTMVSFFPKAFGLLDMMSLRERISRVKENRTFLLGSKLLSITVLLRDTFSQEK